MFQRYTAILLIFCTLAANFSRLFVFAGFKLNQKYIASNLCENRDKPWLHCNGHCYFMKKIKAAQEKDKNTEQQIQKNLFQDANCIAIKKINFTSRLLQVFTARDQFMMPRLVSIDLFHPPQNLA